MSSAPSRRPSGGAARRPSAQKVELVLEKSTEKRVKDLGKELEGLLMSDVEEIDERWFEIGVARAKKAPRRGMAGWMPRGLLSSSRSNLLTRSKSTESADVTSSSSSSFASEQSLGIVGEGSSYDTLLDRIEDIEGNASEEKFPRFFVGILRIDRSSDELPNDHLVFAFQFVGANNVAAIKASISNSSVVKSLSESVHADVTITTVQSSYEVSRDRIAKHPRNRSRKRCSGEIKNMKMAETDRTLSIDFISENENLLHTWNSIRHDVTSQDLTWMVLGYHENPFSDDRSGPRVKPGLRRSSGFGKDKEKISSGEIATTVPVLLSRGGGGIEAFGSEEILHSVQFRPGWLYWIYARVDVENIEGTGRFRASSIGDHEEKPFKAGGSKFILMSFCVPLDESAMLPAMSFRLLHHRPILAKVLKYHVYLEARSFADLSEDSVVNRLVAYSDAGKIVLTVFIGSGTGGTLRKLTSGSSQAMNTPLMIRINPKAKLGELKSRIATAYSWDADRVVVMRVERKNNRDVLRSLARAKIEAKSESDLKELMSKASSQVIVKELEGDRKTLTEMNLVSGDELYIQLVKSGRSRVEANMTEEMNQIGLVERRRRQIEDFLALRERQQQFRLPMYTNLYKTTHSSLSSTMELDEMDGEEDEEYENESLSVRTGSSRKSKAAKDDQSLGGKESPKMRPPLPLQLDLITGRRNLRRSIVEPKPDPVRSPSSELKRFNYSVHLLHLLTEEATKLGARIVDDEDLIIFWERILGDGKTARVREGLLLCKLEELPTLEAKARKSTIVKTRASWNLLRKKSIASPHSQPAMLFKAAAEAQALEDSGEYSERKHDDGSPRQSLVENGKVTQGRASIVSALPAHPGRGLFEFVALKVAVKMFTARFVTKEVFANFQEEISVLIGLHHPSIVQILGVYIDQAPRQDVKPDHTFLMIMYELMPRGSLRQLREDKGCWVDILFSVKLKMALEVARGIMYLHTRDPPVVHRDLKSDNLLVDEDFTLKIGDFGISTRALQGGIRAVAGTSGWIAPEVYSDAGYGTEVDIFSLGVILWELITSEKNPLVGIVGEEYVTTLRRGFRPTLPEPASIFHEQYNILVEECWAFEPEHRPTASSVVDRLSSLLEDVLLSADKYC